MGRLLSPPDRTRPSIPSGDSRWRWRSRIAVGTLRLTEEFLERLKTFVRADDGRFTYQYEIVTLAGTYKGPLYGVDNEFVEIRIETGYREYRNVYIRTCCICAIREYFSAE
jgi:hypothetical protein